MGLWLIETLALDKLLPGVEDEAGWSLEVKKGGSRNAGDGVIVREIPQQINMVKLPERE